MRDCYISPYYLLTTLFHFIILLHGDCSRNHIYSN